MLELQKELEEQEERDKDFLMLQRLAEEEVRTNQRPAFAAFDQSETVYVLFQG